MISAMKEAVDLPFLRDRHSHVSLYAALDGCPDISRLDQDAALRLLRALPQDELSLVLGWYSARVAFSPADLAALPPAIIVNFSLHGVLLTDAAKALLKDAQPELVERHRDAQWCERHVAELLSLYGRCAPLTAAKLDAFMKKLDGLGVASAEDMLVLGEPALDCIASSPWAERVACWADPDAFLAMSPRAQGRIAGLKLFLDGALAMRTAALHEPYLGGGDGLLLHEDEELLAKLAGLALLQKPLAIHAIGRRAVGQALQALERLAQDKVRLPAVRLEHVQFMDEAQAVRAKALGLVLCLQPNFSADSRDYADRLGPALRQANNPLRMLIDEAGFEPGEDLVFGSDGMPHGAQAALQWALFPDVPGQRLSAGELAAGYGPAWDKRRLKLSVDEGLRQVGPCRAEASCST